MNQSSTKKGPIAWMARNSVASNLLMIVLIVGGLLVGRSIKQEVFPEFEMDMVSITVPYPGASPAEVEQGLILAVEEAVRGLDGIKRITATARESSASVVVELLLDADRDKAAADIKAAIDRITSFPADSERPVVSLVTNRREVVSLVVYGDLDEHSRRRHAETVRTDLLQHDKITQVELSGMRAPEIGVEVPQAVLRAHGLTLEQIAGAVRRSAIELPAGGVKTSSGEVLLRTDERRNEGQEFADIQVISMADGTRVRLGDIAKITEDFVDTDQYAFFNGKPAGMVKVYRIGDQTPIDVSDAVREYIDQKQGQLPDGVQIAIWNDSAEIYRARMDLLMRNARLGLILVLGVLGLFLNMRLAFWVTMGIPISFMGSLLLMPSMNVTINMVSLFAFIVTLGMVVDDAIVVGEEVFDRRRKGMPPMEAAITGARAMAMPVTFAILTTLAAFSPLFFVPGFMGKIFGVIPAIVVSVLLISLVESLFVLPAHLAHMKERPAGRGPFAWIGRQQERFSLLVERFMEEIHKPMLRVILRWRYLAIGVGLAMLIATIGWIAGGRMAFTFMPQVDSDIVSANAVLPYGSPVAETEAVQKLLVAAAREVLARHDGDKILRGLYTEVGSLPAGRGPRHGGAGGGGGHLTGVRVFLVGSENRDVTATEFAREWREAAGDIVGLESLTFRYSTGPSAGDPIDVELSHPDMATLELAAADLAEQLRTFAGVKDIDDGFAVGKPQLSFSIRPAAGSMGMRAMDLGRQVRNAFYGVEALRQQRGRDEIRVMVRLPLAERGSEHDIESLMLRAPNGGEMPLHEAAEVRRGSSYTEILRYDGRRTVNVTADIVPAVTSADKVLNSLRDKALPQLKASYPGLHFAFGGERRERVESLQHLGRGYMIAIILIFALLAIPFRSYLQPLVVMSAIPFGIVGAVIGHIIMGFDLSVISMMGIVALSGVVVNDSLVMVDAANRRRREGHPPFEAMLWAGVRRFRPIILTSLTTFFGLAPMIFEPSVQARFLIPMAISLGFGIIFSTFIILGLVPCFYMVIEDVRGLFSGDVSAQPVEPAGREGAPVPPASAGGGAPGHSELANGPVRF